MHTLVPGWSLAGRFERQELRDCSGEMRNPTALITFAAANLNLTFAPIETVSVWEIKCFVLRHGRRCAE